MITIKQTGNFNKTERFLTNARKLEIQSLMDEYGQKGVEALASATPKDTGLTSESWNYTVTPTKTGYRLNWVNDNDAGSSVPIVILIQYGHAHQNGSYIQGIDFINPAIIPIFDELAAKLWEEVSKL